MKPPCQLCTTLASTCVTNGLLGSRKSRQAPRRAILRQSQGRWGCDQNDTFRRQRSEQGCEINGIPAAGTAEQAGSRALITKHVACLVHPSRRQGAKRHRCSIPRKEASASPDCINRPPALLPSQHAAHPRGALASYSGRSQQIGELEGERE